MNIWRIRIAVKRSSGAFWLVRISARAFLFRR